MKKLIVNADDFGLCPSVNRAIIECHLAGNINSTTLMANMPGTEEAIALSKNHTKLKTGLHFCVTEGKAMGGLSTLTKPDQSFYNWGELNKLAIANKINSNDIIKEFYAQYEFLTGQGIKITHFDSHQHIHMNNTLFKACANISNDLNIPVRLVDPIVNWKLLYQKPKKGIKQFLLKVLSKRHRRLLNIKTNNALVAVHDLSNTNIIDRSSYKQVLTKARNHDIVELMAHPYIVGEDVKKMYQSSWNEKLDFLSISSSEFNILKEKDFIYNLTGIRPYSYA